MCFGPLIGIIRFISQSLKYIIMDKKGWYEEWLGAGNVGAIFNYTCTEVFLDKHIKEML